MWPFKKEKPQIRLEITYPSLSKKVLWAVIPEGYNDDEYYPTWLKIQEYEFNQPPPADPNLVSWVRRD